MIAQSFGIAPAKSIRLCPFDGFDSYVTIRDNPPKESLFSAQCLRVKLILDMISKAKNEGQKLFIIADEILTGTNFVFAGSLAQSLIKEFSGFPNCVYLLATHFDAVTENLDFDSNGKFENLQVLANLDEKGFFESPKFKVGSGISYTDAAFKVAASRFGPQYQHIIDNAKPLALEEIKKKKETTGK